MTVSEFAAWIEDANAVSLPIPAARAAILLWKLVEISGARAYSLMPCISFSIATMSRPFSRMD